MPKPESAGEPSKDDGAPDTSKDPCATNDMVVAACLEATTALAPLGDERAVVGTGQELKVVARGAKPRSLAKFNSTIRQILPSRSVLEDGQVWVLLHDGSIHRVTMLSSKRNVVQEVDDAHGAEVILLTRDGEIVWLRNVSDQYFHLVSACQDPVSGTPVLTGYEYGIPMVAAWSGGQVKPIGTVDAGEEVGGCQVNGENLLVAGPKEGKVMHQKIAFDRIGTFEFNGAPTTAVTGDFGRIQAVGVSQSGEEELFWISTSNKSTEATEKPKASDDRVIIVPGGSSSGASPD